MVGQALAERVKQMEGAVHQAHDWLCANPLPWDPILWAQPPDPLNPFSVSHGAFSNSVQMPPRTRPTYQHPPPLPKHALKKPSKPRPVKKQPAIRRTPRISKCSSKRASAPPRAPSSSTISRPTQHSRPRQPQKRVRSPQRSETTITWAPPRRTQATRPLSPPHSRARHRQTRLPFTSKPTTTRCQAPSAHPITALLGTSEIVSAHTVTFCPLHLTPSALCPFLSPQPPLQGNLHSSNDTIRAATFPLLGEPPP